MTHESARSTQTAAAAELAELAARRETIANLNVHRPRRYYLAMALVLGVGIALGVLHNQVLSVVALPFMLYAWAGLIGLGDWQRIGVIPRRPRGMAVVGLALYIMVAVPACWAAAYFLDARGNRWALPVAGVLVPLLLIGGRVWTTNLRRRGLRP